MIAIALQKHWERRRILIVCQNAFVGVWPREFKKHSVDDYEILTLNTKSVEDRGERLRSFLKGNTNKLVVITLYESFWMGRMRGEIMDGDFDSIIFDECQNIKTPGGKASRFASYICKKIPKRLGFQEEGIIRNGEKVYDNYFDIVVYGILKTEFKC